MTQHKNEEFGDECGVTFKPKTSVNMCITHTRDAILPNLILDGQPIKWVKKENHLGNIL